MEQSPGPILPRPPRITTRSLQLDFPSPRPTTPHSPRLGPTSPRPNYQRGPTPPRGSKHSPISSPINSPWLGSKSPLPNCPRGPTPPRSPRPSPPVSPAATNEYHRWTGPVPRILDGAEMLMARLEVKLAVMEASQTSSVKLSKAELELLLEFEEARKFMNDLMQNSDDHHLSLLKVFGGNCTRLARLRAILESTNFSGMHENDPRLASCLQACESVEKVVVDKGLQTILNVARNRELAAIQEEDESVDECIPFLSEASLAELEAIRLEWQGDLKGALHKYAECKSALKVSITTAKAIQKLKARRPMAARRKASVSGGFAGAAAGSLVKDLLELEAHGAGIDQRIDHLTSLDTGQKPTVPVEKHIKPATLGLHRNKGRKLKAIAEDSKLGAVGGLFLLGPVGAANLGPSCAAPATSDDGMEEVVPGAFEVEQLEKNASASNESEAVGV